MVLNTKTENCVRVRGPASTISRNVDVDIPRNAVVVFTGLSGSDKSSFLVDSVIAEKS